MHVRRTTPFTEAHWLTFQASARVFAAFADAFLADASALIGDGHPTLKYNFFPAEISEDRTLMSLPIGGERTLGSRHKLENSFSYLLWLQLPPPSTVSSRRASPKTPAAARGPAGEGLRVSSSCVPRRWKLFGAQIAGPPDMVALSLVVIRAADIERAARFYAAIGLELQRESHGNGPEHYVAEMAGLVFEIYPLAGGKPPTTEVRLGFRVADVDVVVGRMTGAGVDGSVVISPRDTREAARDFEPGKAGGGRPEPGRPGTPSSRACTRRSLRRRTPLRPTRPSPRPLSRRRP